MQGDTAMVTRLRPEPTDRTLIDQLQQLVASAPQSEFSGSLAGVFAMLGDGTEVTCVDPEATLTPAEAAEQLGVSRPFVYRLLDRGVLPFHSVGRDRRIPYAAVVAYIERRESGRKELAETFASAESDRQALLRELAGLS